MVSEVLQIVKFQSIPAKVRMVIDSHHSTPREMSFESARVRGRDDCLLLPLLHRIYYSEWRLFQKCDAFCQLLQLMKARHSQLTEPDMVSVFVGTWNMGEHELSSSSRLVMSRNGRRMSKF